MNTMQKLAVAVLAAGLLLSGCKKKESPAVPPETSNPVQTVTEAKAQTECPVMGGKIDKQYFADYEGKRVYFCCPACKEPFLKEPLKYVKAMEEKGIALEKAPAQ